MEKELFNVLEYIVVAVVTIVAMLVFFFLYSRHLKKKEEKKEEKMYDYDSPFPTSEKDMKVVHKKKRRSTGSAYRDRKRG